MLLLELAVQSVRGFSGSTRITLKSGYWGLKSPNELPAPLVGLLVSLAYPDGRGGDASFLAPGARAGRAGFSVQADDQQVWRLVRDLGGAGSLHKLNRQTNQYELVTQESGEMAQVLRASIGFPARSVWEQLFLFTGPQLPSRRPKTTPAAAASAASAKGRNRLPSALDSYQGESQGSQERLAALEKELAAAKELAEYQFRMDGVTSEIFQVGQKVKALEDLKARLAAARAEMASAPTPRSLGLPDDIAERVRRNAEDKARYENALRQLEQEREAAGVQEAIHVDPLYRDQRFVGSLLLGLALLVGAGFLEGGMRYVALLAMPAFSFAGLLALRSIEELQHAARELAKGDIFETRRKKLVDEYELGSSIVSTAFEKTGAATRDEFFQVLARAEELRPTLAQLELDLADFESDPETAQLAENLEHLTLEQEEMNDRLLQATGGYHREVAEIERELARLKEATAPAPAPEATEGFSAVSVGPGEVYEDPVPALMALGADFFATDLLSLWGILKDRTVQYLGALTDRRYHGISLDRDGRATIDAPGRTIPAGELPAKDLDLLYLSLRLTLIEKASAQRKLPVVLEDTFQTIIDLPKQGLFGRMLKHLGTLTQVLHVTPASLTASAADAQVNL